MKNALIYILLFLLNPPAYGEMTNSLNLYHESRDEHQATGVSIQIAEWNNVSPYLFSFGISANKLHSNLALEHSNRDTIYPVYLFMNLSLNYVVSPFAEFGVDVGDAIIDKAFEGDGEDVDIYFSVGLTLTVQKAVNVSFYQKTYNLYFNEIADTTLQNVHLDLTGISVGYHF